MGRAGLLHLHLSVAVARVNIVKLLLPAQPGIALHLGIEILVHVDGQHAPAQEEAQVVEGGKTVLRQAGLSHIVAKAVGADKQQGAHLEVVAHGPHLAVGERHGAALPVGRQRVVVAVEQLRTRVLGHRQHTCQGMEAQAEGIKLGVQ